MNQHQSNHLTNQDILHHSSSNWHNFQPWSITHSIILSFTIDNFLEINFGVTFDSYSYLCKTYKMSQQVTNFITTLSQEMNENFKLPTKHDMLQYIVHVFT